MSDLQLDLFVQPAIPPRTGIAPDVAPPFDTRELGDGDLIDALPQAGLHEALALVNEIARRRLASAIPALAELCLRYSGFGRNRLIPQQAAAVEALGAIGGRDASRALARTVVRGAFQGPGLQIALRGAVRLASPLPESLVTHLLHADDPPIRAAAARCVRNWPKCVPLLSELLQDLHEDVSFAAACALVRMGVAAGRPSLLKTLRNNPSAEAIEAVAGIADEEAIVLLGRCAEISHELAGSVRKALESIDHPLATRVLARISGNREQPDGERAIQRL